MIIIHIESGTRKPMRETKPEIEAEVEEVCLLLIVLDRKWEKKIYIEERVAQTSPERIE